ncbi:MAG: hypothetical protein HC769_00570 [Cyanobacteria bacterium CRU_2_1]|nr:hypothetical protein [Cyanobacteria bacterium CRU_2_1]
MPFGSYGWRDRLFSTLPTSNPDGFKRQYPPGLARILSAHSGRIAIASAAEATRNVSELLQDIRNRDPQASDTEILSIVENGLATTQQTNPQKWRRWVDVFSVVFAGGVEAVKIVAPALGIPIEVGKRLYEIYDRNRKQLPSR